MLHLILADPQPQMCTAWRAAFAGEEVEIIRGRFETVKDYDCIVSAANSYGIMDGGIDLALRDFFGRQLEGTVQRMILERWSGEQPVGTAEIVATGHADHPYLIHAPTMRTPKRITDSDAPYTALWSILNAVKRQNDQETEQIRSLLCCGLGTGTGGYPPERAARLMALAWRNFNQPHLAQTVTRARSIEDAIASICSGGADPTLRR